MAKRNMALQSLLLNLPEAVLLTPGGQGNLLITGEVLRLIDHVGFGGQASRGKAPSPNNHIGALCDDLAEDGPAEVDRLEVEAVTLGDVSYKGPRGCRPGPRG